MAYGSELIFGYPFKESEPLLEGLGIKALCLVSPDDLEIGNGLPHVLKGKPDAEVDQWINENITFLRPQDGFDKSWEALDSDGSVNDANDALVDAHYNACLEMGWKPKGKKKKNTMIGEYPIFETPLGLREFSPFSLEVHYDPGEMGEGPEQAILGVAVSGRYFPTFIDWEDSSGTIWNLVCDHTQPMWVIAKKHICTALPWMKDAKWVVKEKHY